MNKNARKYFVKLFLFLLPIYIGLILISLIKVDYYMYIPGNLTNIKNEVSLKGYEDKEINGSISSIYVVSLVQPSVMEYLIAKASKQDALIKMTKQEVSNIDRKLDNAIGSFDILSSFNNAELSALYEYNNSLDYTQVTYIYSAHKNINSNIKYTDLVGKMIYKVNDITYPKLSEVSSYLSSIEDGNDAILTLMDNKNETFELRIKKTDIDNNRLYGITLKTSFIYSGESLMTINDLYSGGPSGGAMQALYLYSLMSEEDIIRGRKIAGTGTIDFELDSSGNLKTFSKIGPIGCVGQKLYSAYISHADVFYCPSDNYNECMEYYHKYFGDKETIRVVKVSYLTDIINDLKGDINQ